MQTELTIGLLVADFLCRTAQLQYRGSNRTHATKSQLVATAVR